ncbi:MAG TPA: hypothetical protein VI485_32450 [Vicinamibacterales bacterium]|nr:hypothetical protein [Vicinamibacterales bacterium]
MAGLLVDLVGSLLLGVGYSIVKVGMDAGAGGDITDQIALTTTDYMVTSVFGLLFVVAGGYVAGRMAGVRSTVHGLCVGLAILALSIVIEVLAPDPEAPMWFNIVSMIAVVPAATIGGRLAGKPTQANLAAEPRA